MKTVQRICTFSPVATAIAMALAAQFPVTVAYANAGFGDSVDLANNPVRVRTYNANSPSGPAPMLDATGKTMAAPTTLLPTKASTGKALRKFVDSLPGIGAAQANNLGQYLPLAVTEKWVDLNGKTTADDYIEIAAVEYTQRMHSDLIKPTRLRGYVQLMTPGLLAMGKQGKNFTMLDGSVLSVVDLPHHLGPVIQATRDTALRVKFVNHLPLGGKLFVPVDGTVTGAGVGPDGVTPYSENRAVLHLVAGGLPWISAGTPHQWVAPAGETNPGVNPLTGLDAPVVDARGVSTNNVPDMADPGPGATTLYFPNDMSARFMFYHDRTSGLTRLNAYAGMEAGYLVTDAAEQALIAAGTIPGAADTIPLIIEDKTFVPADIAQQDAKWNVNKDSTAATAWGQPGDLWFPHVYEPNQDPNSAYGINTVGRFDYGPLFWPIFPAFDPTPTGFADDATIVPEAYLDTPVINGTAYPTLTVDPKAYRFRILNASVDRYLNLGLYKADTTAGIAPQLDDNGNPIFNAAGTQQFFTGTEVKLVSALAADALGNPPTPVSAEVPYDPACLCQYPHLPSNVKAEASGAVRAWPIDARRGGVPDPLSVGPDIIAIGNDGGFLPNPVDIPSQPITFEANRRSITVNNAYGYGLLLGPAERSDAIIDFSQYAGQTLIVYNDAPAPFPFSDERNDYYTGNPDMSGVGGAYATQPGYGPNTRTILQIKVKAEAAAIPRSGKNQAAVPAVVAAAPFNADALLTALPAAYAATQAAPLVPAVAYNKAFATNDPDIYAHIATGAAAQPTLDFTTTSGAIELTGLKLITAGGVAMPGGAPGPAGIFMQYNTGSGSGYHPDSPPQVVFNNVVNGTDCLAATGVSASAKATVDPVTRQVSGIVGFLPGSGYTCAPTVSFINTAPVSAVALVGGGTGYVKPVVTITGGGGTGATATATVEDGVITGIAVSAKGSGYTAVPTLAITDASGGGALANAVLAPSLGVGAQVAVQSNGAFRSYPVKPLAEQELFDNRGRYNKTGGVEMPFSNAVNQTTVPLNYIDAATESIADGETQVWKITVNGLFSNNLSFNLADVQLLNRVGWDGTVKPPSSNELGWKSTVRMNPLEDVVVAIRAKRARVPFGMPQSRRARDPSKPLGQPGSGMGFTFGQGVPQLDTLVNVLENYDNESYWNSALLSNSEIDFLRPIVFRPTVLKPDAPGNLTDAMGDGTLSWADPTPAGQLAAPQAVPPLAATLANPQNEIGFKILQATLDADGNLGSWAQAVSAAGVPVSVPSNVTRWVQPLPLDPSIVYAVVAYNAAGDSAASVKFAQTIPVAPTVFTADEPHYNAVTLRWSGGTSSNKLDLYRTEVATGVTALLKTLHGSAKGHVDKSVAARKAYSYQIQAINTLQPVATGAAISAVLTVTTPMMPVAAPTIVSALPSNTGRSVALRWTDNANNDSAYWIDVAATNRLTGVVTLSPQIAIPSSLAQRTAIQRALNRTLATAAGNTYTITLTAVNVTAGVVSTSAPVSVSVDLSVAMPSAPVVVAGVQTATRMPLSWTAVTVPGATMAYGVQVSTNGSSFVDMAPTTRLTTTLNLAPGTQYQFRVLALATRFGLTVQGPPSAAVAVTVPMLAYVAQPAPSTTPVARPAMSGNVGITLTWSNPSSDVIHSFTVTRRFGRGAWVTLPAIAAASVATAVKGSFSWTDTGLTSGGLYQYRLLATGAGGVSVVSASSNRVIAP